MKSLSKLVRFSLVGAVLASSAVLGMSPAFADSPGQLGGGTRVYNVQDLTTGGSYANSINAKAGDELQYKIWLHNGAYGAFSDVQVKVNLPSSSSTTNTSTATATTNLGGTTGTNGTVTVNLSSAQTITIESGTTTLSDDSGHLIRTLPDTITGNGVDLGPLNGSTVEIVTFKAKVSTPPVTPPVTPPAKVLPNTGPGDMLGAFAGASAVGGIGHYFISRRRK